MIQNITKNIGVYIKTNIFSYICFFNLFGKNVEKNLKFWYNKGNQLPYSENYRKY